LAPPFPGAPDAHLTPGHTWQSGYLPQSARLSPPVPIQGSPHRIYHPNAAGQPPCPGDSTARIAKPVAAPAAYASVLNMVKSLGQDFSATRTADQTTQATFWGAAPSDTYETK